MNHVLEFKPITLGDKKTIDALNASVPTYADWAFGTLLMWWDFYDDMEFAILNDNLIVRSSYLTYGQTPRMTIVGNTGIDHTIQQIFDYQLAHDEVPMIASSPEYTIQAATLTNHYEIEEDPDNAEYVISAKEHADLTKPELKKIRHKVHAFENIYGSDIIRTHARPITDDNHRIHLVNNMHTWDSSYKNDHDRMESVVINKTLLASDTIGMHSLCVYLSDELVGFALYKQISPDTINVNHLKVNYSYKDIFQYVLHTLANEVRPLGIEYINIEQDLGIDGIRTYKQRLHPAIMNKKYTIRPKM